MQVYSAKGLKLQPVVANADVMLGLAMDDWAFLLERSRASDVYARERFWEVWAKLDKQYGRHKAAQRRRR